FNCTQRQQGGFLRFCQPLGARDAHARVRFRDGERFEALGRLYAPEFDHPIIVAAGEQVAIGAEGDPPDAAVVSVQGVEAAAAANIPQAHAAIIAAAGKQASSGAKVDGPDPTAVALEGTQALGCGGVPQADGVVLASAGKQATVEVESDGSYPIRVTP